MLLLFITIVLIISVIFANKNEGFYLKFSDTSWMKKGQIIKSSAGYAIVINPSCKDPKWKRICRKLGFKLANHKGCTKVKNYYKYD